MPNWCENELEVTGPREDLDRFIQAVMSDRSKFDFDRVIPYPLAFKNQDLIAQTTREMGWKDSKGRYPRDGFNSGGYLVHCKLGHQVVGRRCFLCRLWDFSGVQV